MKICGILNITNDSFSGDGILQEKDVLAQVHNMIKQGVDIIDVGAQATNPYVKGEIGAKEEMRRLYNILPKIVNIANLSDVLVSIDSYNHEVLSYAINSGVRIINDQKGLQDTKIIELLINNIDKIDHIIFMHSIVVPADLNVNFDDNIDIVKYLVSWAKKKINTLLKCGLPKNKLIFDPGIGFATTKKHICDILKNTQFFDCLGIPLYIGHSRKRFLGSKDTMLDSRDFMTVAISGYLYAKGVDFIRVHNVRIHRKFIDLLY